MVFFSQTMFFQTMFLSSSSSQHFRDIFLLLTFRRHASLNAVRNCRSKALSIAQLLNQTLGSPILIQEENMTEHTGESQDQINKSVNSIQELIENNTVTISVKIYMIFECKERTKKTQQR